MLRWSAAAGLAGCGVDRRDDLVDRIDHAWPPRLRALIAAQSPDGAWRSPTYGVFSDGLSLTPPVLKAVAFGPDVEGAGRRPAPGRRLPGRSRPRRRLDRRRAASA